MTLLLSTLLLGASGLQIFVAPVVTSPGAARAARADLNLAVPIAEQLAAGGDYRVLTRSDVTAILEEQANRQLLGCDELPCQVELAVLAQSQLLVRLEVGYLAGQFVLTGTLLEPGTARVLERRSRRVDRPEALLDGLGRLALGLLSPQTDEAPRTASTGTGVVGRVLTVVSTSESSGLLDGRGAAALERRIADRIATTIGVTTLGREEARGMIEELANRQRLGAGADETEAALWAVAQDTAADYLVAVDLGRVGGRTLVSASLLDAGSGAIAGRSSLLLPSPDLVALAAENVALGVFGFGAEVPRPPPDPNAVDAKLAGLAQQIHRAFLQQQNGSLARLGIVALEDRGEVAARQQMGRSVATLLEQNLREELAVPMISAARLEELEASRGGAMASPLDADGRQQVAMFLGATVLVTGSVSELGSDYLIETRLSRGSDGQELGRAFTFLPRGLPDLTSLRETFVERSRSGALFRAVVPGWGQFYNGHAAKGVVVLAGTAAGLAAMGLMLGLAAGKDGEAATWDRGGSAYIGAGCTSLDFSTCADARNGLLGEADDLRIGAIISVAVAAAAYLYGFIDAGIYGGTYEP